MSDPRNLKHNKDGDHDGHKSTKEEIDSQELQHETKKNVNDEVEKSNKVREKFVLGAESDDEDSEGESGSLLAQRDDILYGTTPPRHVRRMKCKFSRSGKKESKSHITHPVSSTKERQRVSHSHKKDYLRKISHDRNHEEVNEEERYPPRMVLSINATFDRYRSIKSVPALLDKHHQLPSKPDAQGSFSKSRSFGDISKGENCPPHRMHFMKTFQLLVKLGDRHGKRDSRRTTSVNDDADEQPENWQIQFDQVLWLELQAWRFGRGIEEQDSYLLEERKRVDDSLDQIIHFFFPTKLEKYEAMNANQTSMLSKAVKIPDSQHTNSNTQSHHPSSKSVENPSTNLPFSPHDVDHYCSTIDDHFTGSIQRKAMHIIIMLLKKVEDATALYPTSKALSQCHPLYLNEKFIRNYETLNVWLNICKELYHKLQVVASLVDVDVEDNKTWEDWFDHGLGLTCIKTHKTYKTRRLSFREDQKPQGVKDANNTNEKLNSSNPDSKVHLHKRRSVLKETSTSRYRSFVEKNIRQIGLHGLSQRIKSALHRTLWKARQALEVPREAHEMMEREHNYGKVIDLIKFLEKMTYDDPSQRTIFASMVLHPDDFKTDDQGRHERGVWSKEFSEMGLPSFLELYLFIAKIAFDIIHESIRYRLEHRPKGDPSSMSIKQLINECKEVISAAIIGKYYYQDMTLSVLTADDKARIDILDTDINEFEEDVQALLSVYFDYLQHLFQMLQRLPEASRSLKNTMEDEWQFTKEICPHTKGLEAQASRRFCILATGLLDSTAQFLESSLDDCSCELYDKMDKSSEKVKDIALEACRNHKKLYNEIRERSAKALGFAKMLQKDLGIAAEYKVEVSVQKILDLLKQSQHVKIDCKSSEVNYEIYTQKNLAADKRQILKLLNVTCGFEDPAEAGNSQNDGYIILLHLNEDESDGEDEKIEWNDEIVHVSPTVDTAIALANLQVDGLMVIACNSYQLFTQRNALHRCLGNSITLLNEQTSSHQTVAEALLDFRLSAERLAQDIVTSVKKTLDTLNLEIIFNMEQGEKDLVHKNYVETMHSCFASGFEYLRELARLLSGQSKDLCPLMLEFSKDWMNFVCKNTEKGRGRRPRWSTNGLEFIVDACNQKHLTEMNEDEFQDMKKAINNSVTHIIGQPEPALSPLGSRAGSPGPMVRMKSHPGGGKTPSKMKDRKLSDNDHHKKTDSLRSRSYSRAPSHSCPVTSHHGSDSESDLSTTSTDSACPISPSAKSSKLDHLETIKASVDKLEKKRTNKLIKKRIIGKISDRKPDLASELVNIKSRRVNFKWHLGNKIGEGQFGKVYSCVNLDSGKLMAMKKIKFNPHDYSSIQDIADEITSIQSLKHESLVEYYGVEIHRREMLIFMEYCEDGTIAQISKIGLPEEIIRVYTLQIVKAVRFVHDNGIVHRDIKGANIFVSSSGLIKLGDFGSAVRLKDPVHTMHGEVCKFRGTAAFMAPEVINHKDAGYGRAADIWSLGCVVIEMATGKTPWEGFELVAIIFRVGDGAVPCIPESLSDEGKDFLFQCLVNDPKERASAEILEGHHFVMVSYMLFYSFLICTIDISYQLINKTVNQSISQTISQSIKQK